MKKLLVVLFFIPLGLLAQVETPTAEPPKVPEKVAEPIKETVEDSALTEKTEVAGIKDANSTAESKVALQACIAGNCENGQGTKNYQSGTYTGEWKNGLRSGYGTYKWTNGDTYSGIWVDDKRHGEGVYVWHDGSKYKGNYSHGIRSGYGIYYYTNGTIYEGTWQNNLKHGIANFYYQESVNIGGRYYNNEYVSGTGITQGEYKYKPAKM